MENGRLEPQKLLIDVADVREEEGDYSLVPLMEFKDTVNVHGTFTNDSEGLRDIFVDIKLAIRALSQDCHETYHTSEFGPRTLYIVWNKAKSLWFGTLKIVPYCKNCRVGK